MSDNPETTATTGHRDATTGRFGPGNPGRPKGARHKLGEAFLMALADDFATHGKLAVERARTDDPSAYLRVIASLMPKIMQGDDEGGPMLVTFRWEGEGGE